MHNESPQTLPLLILKRTVYNLDYDCEFAFMFNTYNHLNLHSGYIGVYAIHIVNALCIFQPV